MKSDHNGVSTCPAGQESYEEFRHHGHTYVQYDYRDHDGELFSCVAPTLDAARKRRNAWLEAKNSPSQASTAISSDAGPNTIRGGEDLQPVQTATQRSYIHAR